MNQTEPLMTDTNLEKMRRQIDAMSQHEMVHMCRFTPAGHPFFQPPMFKYFDSKFKEKGGFNPSISKAIGFHREGAS